MFKSNFSHVGVFKSSKRSFFIACAVVSLGLSVAGNVQAQNALDNVMKSKEIKIAIPTDFPPYGFVGPDLKPQGLDVDMANYIGQKLGVKVDLVVLTS